MKYLIAGFGLWCGITGAAYAQVVAPEQVAAPSAVVEDAVQDNVPEEQLESEMGQEPVLQIPRVEMTRGGYGKVAVLQGLNKVTARISEIRIPVGEEAPFGNLNIRVEKCWKSDPSEQPENAALMEIYDQRPDEVHQRVFRGWMFSSSPSVSDLQHPVYDVIVLRCEAEATKKEG